MSIATIEAQIEVLVAEVTAIKAKYDYPALELGKKLPALIIIYDGVSQDYEATTQTDTTYRFEFTLYYRAEGKTLKTNWDAMKADAKSLLDKFRANPDLNNTCWTSIIRSGRTIIDAANEPKFIGHSFTLECQKVET